MPSAEIIAIGTELLLGETNDTNTRTIARALRDLGVDIYRTHTIGDNAARIAQSVCESLERADMVITTGGLGPTVDDPTRQAIADAAGVVLEFHPELWEQITNRISRYGRAPTENQKRQAYLPKGATAIENPVGTAPAFIMEMAIKGQKGISISLPGVPREMETLLTDAVIPYLRNRYDLKDIIKIRSLHVSGMGEGSIDDLIGDLEMLTNPTVGLTAHSGIVDIRIAAKAPTEPEADEMIARVETDLLERLGDSIFGYDEDTLESVTLKAVADRGWSLATVESGLEGTLMDRLRFADQSAYLGGSLFDPTRQPLNEYAEHIRQDTDATVVLVSDLRVTNLSAELRLLLITPLGSKEKLLHYGGHPKNASRWAANNALDWLRRQALQKG